MSANLPTTCLGRLLLLAFAVIAHLGAGSLSATAQTRDRWLPEELRRADKLYRDDRLQQAEKIYQRIVTVARGDDRRHCFEQLLAIYGRVGRQDQAIQTGLKFRDWLKQFGDAARLRELNLDLGRWYFALGHYAEAEPYLQGALVELRAVRLPPARAVTALTFQALAAEKQGDSARAKRAWQEVEAFALALLDDPREKLDRAVRVECVRRLADSYRFQGQPKKAIQRLEDILPDLDELKEPNPAIRRDCLRQLAGHLAADDRLADAEKRLQEARELHRQVAAEDSLTGADLSCELADVLDRQGPTRAGEAKVLRDQATKDYEAILKDPSARRTALAGALDAFWKLQVLYQRMSNYDLAMKLIEGQSTQWVGGLIEPRLRSEEGRLSVLVGEYDPARKSLEAAVGDLEKQSPVNLIALPPALLNLAVAELGAGKRARAEELGRRCHDRYQKHHLMDDLVLVETYNLLGACAAQDGDYSRAIKNFHAGVACCQRLESKADAPHCNLLLNIALLHKSQGDLESALRACEEARIVYERFASQDDRGFAAIDAATATLLATRGRLKEAFALASGVRERCQKNGIKRGPLVITALHCQALFHLFERRFREAEEAWTEVKDLLKELPKSPLQPRTLNYLALTHECQNQLGKAAELYKQALSLQKDNSLAFPVTHFTTLWRLACVTDRLAEVSDARERQDEARHLLQEAVTLAESARLRTYGGPRQRATFFAQFEPAFDQLVEWQLRNGDTTNAVVTAARGRSLTLLDQMLLGNADPRQSLRGPEGDKLRQMELKLRRETAALRAKAQQASSETLQTKEGIGLLKRLDKAQLDYMEVFGKILNDSPLYRGLGGQGFTETDLDRLRERTLGPKNLLLVYHIGREQSYLLLVGDKSRPAEKFELKVPAGVSERVTRPDPATLEQVVGTRGLRSRPSDNQPDLPPLPATPPVLKPLGHDVLRALVENYLEQIANLNFRSSRGIRLRSKEGAPELPAQRPELLADILLPPAVRQRIPKDIDCLIVVPDGPLHKLPLESLVLRSDDKPSYVIDELPPIAYAPSVAILARLTDREPAAPHGLRSLLTVADPVYPEVKPARPRAEATSATPAELAFRFRALPNTAKESDRIRGYFEPGQVKALTGTQATEKAVVAFIPGRHVVHIAAHGITDEHFDNQFGALVLTKPPPGQEAPDDDGFLSLHEIYGLNLDKCELAVLSACVTNVGPQPPLEAGVTLATGFLAAGARRVVASHWSVDDESTAELMAAFFKKITAAKPGEPVAYAEALQYARKQVRLDPRYQAPYFWAPFVLVGPATDTYAR
jgi:CHAT domain-containing protein/tetratricopeptide (TPR) repeat protein